MSSRVFVTQYFLESGKKYILYILGTQLQKFLVSEEGENNQRCLQSESHPCQTLKYVIENTHTDIHITFHYHKLEKSCFAEDQHINIQGHDRNIYIIGQCDLNRMKVHCCCACSLELFSDKFLASNRLFISNIYFCNVDLIIANVAIFFKNVKFKEVTIRDTNAEPGKENSLSNSKDSYKFPPKYFPKLFNSKCDFENCAWIYDNSSKQNSLKFYFQKSFHLYMFNCTMESTVITIIAAYFSVEFNQLRYTFCFNCSYIVSIRKHSSWFLALNSLKMINVTINDVILDNPKTLETDQFQSVVSIGLANIIVIVSDSYFRKVSQVLAIKHEALEAGNDGVVINMTIVQSMFLNIDCSEASHGGAVSIELSKYVTAYVLANLAIKHSKFINISAVNSGGALYVSTEQYSSVENVYFFVIVDETNFVNCRSEASGGAIYTGAFIKCTVQKSYFEFSKSQYVSQGGLFLFVAGEAEVVDTAFFTKSILTIKVPILIIHSKYKSNHASDIQAKITCPMWMYPRAVHDFKLRRLLLLEFQCISCSGATYFPYIENVNANYRYGLTPVFQAPSKKDLLIFKCQECPLGATCSSGLLTQLPGYWGTKVDNSVKMFPCPSGYCCSSYRADVCDFLHQCSEHRKGTLCGQCKSGFSLSLFSKKCIPNQNCSDIEAWPLSVFAAFLYLLFYTLKNEILGCILYVPKRTIQMVKKYYAGLKSKHLFKSTANDSCHFAIESEQNAFDFSMALGIIIYYTQTLKLIQINLHLNITSLSNKLSSPILQQAQKLLNLDISITDIDMCPFPDLNMTYKVIFSLAFLCLLFTVWLCIYSIVKTAHYFQSRPTSRSSMSGLAKSAGIRISIIYKKHGKNTLKSANGRTLTKIHGCFKEKIMPGKFKQRPTHFVKLSQTLENVEGKLLVGLMEVIKYTYSGFASISFMALSCVQIGQKSVWIHDGSVICMAYWQWFYLVFVLLHDIPFPFVFGLAFRYFRQREFNIRQFLFSCFLPSVFLVQLLKKMLLKVICGLNFSKIGIIEGENKKLGNVNSHKNRRKYSENISINEIQESHEKLSEPAKQLTLLLSDPYKTTGLCSYWESILEIRRLFLSLSIFIDNDILRLTYIHLFSILIWGHHVVVQPYKNSWANKVDSLSLFMLAVASQINAFRASFSEGGALSVGENYNILQLFKITEDSFSIILGIVLIISYRFGNKK